jgi:hypothetical protein
VMAPNPSSGLRNDGAGETDGEASGGGERGKNWFEYVTHGIEGKYLKIFVKESKKSATLAAFRLHY